MKFAFAILLSCSALAQVWGRREALRPVLQGRFVEAELQFEKARNVFPTNSVLLWQAEYDIERARFGEAAAFINTYAQSAGRGPMDRRRRAQLLCATGAYREAFELALEAQKWDRQDVRKLKVSQPISLVTLGEVELARGNYELAVAILDKAARAAKDPRDYSALEWARSRLYLAAAYVQSGAPETALGIVERSFVDAEREWGSAGIPIVDFTDVAGMAHLASGDLKKAEDSLVWALLQRKRIFENRHPKLADSYLHMALLHVAQGRRADAETAVQRALAMHKEFAVGPNGRWALALLDAARVFAAIGKQTEANGAYESAIPVLERELGVDAPRVCEARKDRDALLAP